MSRRHKNLGTYRYDLEVRYLALFGRHLHQDIPNNQHLNKIIHDHWKWGINITDAARGIHATETPATDGG